MRMIPFDHELRLVHFVLLNAFVFYSAWKFIRRAGIDDPIAALLDAALVWVLVQYVSVAIPGLLGLLSNVTITTSAILLCAAMWASLCRRKHAPSALRVDFGAAIPIACFCFVTGYVAALIFHQRSAPVMSIDAMSYHLPAAVQWLQSGRLGLYEAWFYNPANVYSPLAGSVIDVWWIAPMGNDLLVRFVQAPALIITGLGIVQICRGLGAGAVTACLIATFAVMCRPLVSQVDIPKDDLYVAAFFAMSVAAMSRGALNDRLGGWRLGACVGLLLATKYTALLAAVLLLAGIDAPFRAKWNFNRWAQALLCVLLIAGPWYLRNLLLTGNPIYPMQTPLFDGMFRMSRSEVLANPVAGLWHVLTATYHSFPWPLLIVIVAAWLAGAALSWRRMNSDPLMRIAAFGPVMGLALFAILSPYPEIRFLYPALLLMFCMIAPLTRPHAGSSHAHRTPAPDEKPTPSHQYSGERAGERGRRSHEDHRPSPLPSPRRTGERENGASQVPAWITAIIILALALTVAATAFVRGLGVQFTLVGMILAGMGAGAAMLHGISPARRVVAALAGVTLIGALIAFVYWNAYVTNYREFVHLHWGVPYGPIARTWKWVRNELPSDAVLAYTNTYLTYPLYGFDLNRSVKYVPTRRGVDRYLDLPPFDEPATDQTLRRQIERITMAYPSADQWLARLKSSRVTHLLIVKPNPREDYVSAEPPELQMARDRAEIFRVIYESPEAVIFSVSLPTGTN